MSFVVLYKISISRQEDRAENERTQNKGEDEDLSGGGSPRKDRTEQWSASEGLSLEGIQHGVSWPAPARAVEDVQVTRGRLVSSGGLRSEVRRRLHHGPGGPLVSRLGSHASLPPQAFMVPSV